MTEMTGLMASVPEVIAEGTEILTGIIKKLTEITE